MYSRKEVSQRIESILPELDRLKNHVNLDEYGKVAIRSLLKQLQKIQSECDEGILVQKLEYKGAMARLVAESDPSVLSSKLDGEIIDIEKAYYEL